MKAYEFILTLVVKNEVFWIKQLRRLVKEKLKKKIYRENKKKKLKPPCINKITDKRFIKIKYNDEIYR